MSTAHLGIYKLSTDVIFWKDVILSLWCQTATTPTLVPTVIIRFIEATSIAKFQLEDFDFITSWLITSTGHDIIVMSSFHFLIGDIVTGAACGAGNTYPSWASDLTSGFHRGSCCRVICVVLFHVIVFSFGFWVLIVPFVWLLSIYNFYS